MRTHQKVFWAVGLAGLGAFSLAGFLSNIGLISRSTVYLTLTKMWFELPVGIVTGAAFLFLFVLSIYLPASTWLRGTPKPVTISNPLGPVAISSDALSKFIQRVSAEIEDVRDVKVEVRPVEAAVECYVSLEANGNVKGGVPELLNDFQGRVKEHLLETVGVSEVKKVQVRVTKLFQKGEEAR